MNRLSILLSLLFAFVGSKADEYVESFNIISDSYVDNIQDARIIRNINGGTVIIPDFDETCPEEIKAPFSYACKIVEEYLPPCMPLRVAVSCGTLRGSYENAISKVLAKTEENFGMSPDFDNVQMSVIKGVILAELAHSSTVSYFDSVPDVKFLTEKPDIIVTYNDQRLGELSFSIDPEPGENYDFVSIAVRDLLIGLGLSSSYRKDPLTGGLLDPSQKKTPFECIINQALGYYGNSAARMNQATRGEIVLKDFSKSLKLHAPSTWRNGVSLNYFVPQEDCCVSNILSYNFCRGMVTRSLSDQYADFIFRFLLGWRPNYSVSTDNEMSITTGGSTSLLMPYNGSISFKGTKEGIHSVVNRSDGPMLIKNSGTENEALKDYINSFDPFRGYEDFDAYSDGTSVSVLKKDGTWDVVMFIPACVSEGTFLMSDWEFNCGEDEYARTIDGYLRARLSTKREDGSSIHYSSKFFVIDYIPQKVNLSFAFTDSPSSRSSSSNVRIYFSNTEGIDRIVLEKLLQGNRLPSKIEILDVKKGYFDTTVSRTTTFTAVGYNDNGGSRSVPITISPLQTSLDLNIKMEDDHIYLLPCSPEDNDYSYMITPIDRELSPLRKTTYTSEGIDISTLQDGMFVLTVVDNISGESKSFKLKK